MNRLFKKNKLQAQSKILCLSCSIKNQHVYIYRVFRKNKLRSQGVFSFSNKNDLYSCKQCIDEDMTDRVMNAIEGLKLWGGLRAVGIKAFK